MKQIPNIFTLLNLFFGCIAIVYALQVDNFIININDDFSSSFNIPEKLVYAAVFICIAAAIDFLDGFVARLFNASSELGRQLDSLADVVSFGVAPGMILYQLLRLSYMQQENGLDISIGWLLPAFIFSCAGAYRLGRFNIDRSQSYGFKGVPIPAAGLVVASLPLILHNGSSFVNISQLLINKWVLYSIIILLSVLMASTLPMMALKFKDFTVKNNLPKIILLGVAVVAGFFLHWLAVPVVFLIYIILSLLFKDKQHDIHSTGESNAA